MTAFTDAKASLQTSVTDNRDLLKVQDVQATLNATLAPLVAIRKAMVEWARAVTALKGFAANTDADYAAVAQDPMVVELRQLAAKFAGDVAEVKNDIEQIALKARTLPAA